MLIVMGDPASLRLVLELEPDGDPVRGWLQAPDGVRERFEGLLGLLAVLDAARASPRARSGRTGEDLQEG
jgi:hypothetical protein